MADFLTRLVGRTLGMTPTVQPVLTPMFALEPDRDRRDSALRPLGGPPQGISRSPISPTLEGESANNPASPRVIAVSPVGDTSMVPSAGETFTEQAYDGHAQEAAPAMHTRSQSTAQTQPHAELSMPLAQQQAHTAIERTPAIESHTVGAGEVVVSRDKPLLPSQVPTTPVGSDQWAHTDETGGDVPSTGLRTGAVGIVSGPDPVPTVRHVVGSDAPGTEQRGGWLSPTLAIRCGTPADQSGVRISER